jgi:hypothetical protein
VRLLGKGDLAAAMLAACTLGLGISPLLYVAIGALSAFPAAFSLALLPPFVAGVAFLLWWYLRKPADRTGSVFQLVAEMASWLAVAVFLFFVSGVNLQTTAERVGLSCVFFLIASACCLPLTLTRETALEARIRRLPMAASVGVLLAVLVVAGVVTAKYLLTPPAFI